jgi:hypothetical protein
MLGMHLPDLSPRLNHFGDILRRAACSALGVGLLACASYAPGAAAAGASLDRFERLRAQDLQVERVAYRLSIANGARCAQVLAPQAGFVLHDIAQYAAADRADAARAFGLDGQPGVMAVVDGSPAARAGLRAGDRLRAVNGRSLDRGDPGSVPTRAGVERAQQMLGAAMRDGPVVLRVSTAAGDRDVRFLAESGCPSNVELVPGDTVNAWADGERVMVSEGLLRRCATDGDLALVIGHEMAHNLLHHRRRLAAEGIVANTLLPAATGPHDLRKVRETEEEADRLAVSLATMAAYDLGDAEPFMSGLLRGDVAVANTHPARDRRLTLLRAAIAEARQGRARSAVLTG